VVLSNGANTFTGGTNINAGLLQMNGSTSLASTTVSVASGATLNVSTGTSLTASSLTLNDSGTVNYAPSNFSIGSLSGSAPGVLNMTAPAGFALTIGGGTYGGNITGTSGSVAFTGSNTFSGTISDGTTAPISVTVNASSGTVVFSGSNTYTGGTYLVSGATEITSASAVGPSTIYLQGGALGAYGGSVNLPNLLTGGALIVPSNSGLLEISNSANTFTGPVVIQSGATLQVDSPGAIGGMNGANATTGTIIVASGATFIANDNSGTLGLTGGVPGGAPISLVLSGSGVGAIGALTTPSGTPTGSNGTWAGGINISGPAQVSPGLNATLTLSGAITGNGPVSFAPTSNSSSSSNTIILSPPTASSNTYTGESQVYGGTGTLVAFTVQLGNSNGFSPDAGLNFNGGTGGVTVDLYGNNQTVTYLTGSGPAGSALTNSNGNPSTLTISSGLNNGAPSTFSTPIGGNVAVVMNDPTGQGNQILSGASNYSGGTTITKGTLSVAAPSALGTGTVFLNGGTLAFPSASPGSLSNYVLNGVATYGNNTLTLTNNGQDEASSAFTRSPVAINLTTGFTVSYLMNLNAVNTGYVADGIGFVLQNDSRGANAVGNGGSGIGWTGIQNSFVAGFETYGYDFGQGGANDVEFGTSGGGAGTFNQVTTSGLALTSEPAEVVLTYNGSQFTETITEEGGAGASYTTTYAVNLASVLGSSTAYLGFTGGTGDGTATQTVTNFSLSGVAAGAISIANPIVANPGTTSVIQVATGSGNTTETFTSLNLGSGSVVTITTPNGSTGKLVVSTPSLTIAQNSSGAFTAKLDVGINSLDLPANSTNTLAGITAMVAQGYAGGKWNGEGIASSAAAADTTFLTALGVIANDNGSGTPLYGPGGTIASTFEGATPADGDILVKLTYYGDADLSGTVDGSDYSRIDNGILLGLTGWQNGDFNYDGVIDGSDYTLIDNSYNTQGAQFTTEVAATTAEIAAVTGSSVSGSAVPEPTTLGLIGIGAAAMLGRRRRRMI